MDEKTVTNRRSLLKGLAVLTVTAGAAPVVIAVASVHNRAAALVEAQERLTAQPCSSTEEC